MKAEQWNKKIGKYEPYKLPKLASMYEKDMSMVIQCALCAEPILYGKSYSSRNIHNHIGLAYAVCYSCHQKETNDELKHFNITKEDLPF